MSSGVSTSPTMAAAKASGPCVVSTYSRLSGSSPPRKLCCASGPSPGALSRPCCARWEACSSRNNLHPQGPKQTPATR